MEDSLNKERTVESLKLFARLIENNSTEFAYMENITSMLIKFSKKNERFRNYFYGDKIVDKVNKWLSANQNPPVNSHRSQNGMFKSSKKNNKFSYDIVLEESATIKEFNTKRKAELRSMYKKLNNWEDPDLESEDDVFETELKTEAMIDFEDASLNYQWVSGVITCSLGNIIKVVKEQDDEMEVDGRQRTVEDFWFNKGRLLFA